MISAELRAQIRRLFFAEHWKVGTIAAELKLHAETVKSALEVERFTNAACKVRPSLLDGYKPFLLQTLDEHPDLRSTRLFQMVKARGYQGNAVQVRRYVRQVRPQSLREAFLVLRTLPGEQAQVDWGSFGSLQVGHTRRALSCFIMVLAWSRAVYARFFFDQTLESFMAGLVKGFEAFGGVPRNILFDNLKAVVLERVGDHLRFQPRLMELAGHYHFLPKPCAPYRGNEKGKVERTVQDLRHSFFAARTFSSLQDLNRQLAAWIEEVRLPRLVPGDEQLRSIRSALAEERQLLLPLPQHPFDCQVVRPVTSGKTPYVVFDGNLYSIPHTLIKKPLTLTATEEVIRVLDNATEVARHSRSYERKKYIEDRTHLDELAKHKQAARELRGRDLLRSQCPSADAFLEELGRRHSPLSSNTTQLAKLLEQHGGPALEEGLKEALGRGTISATAVAYWLDQRARASGAPPAVPPVPLTDPRAATLTVTPHDLCSYDALYHLKEEE